MSSDSDTKAGEFSAVGCNACATASAFCRFCSLSLSEIRYFMWRLALPLVGDNLLEYAPQRQRTRPVLRQNWIRQKISRNLRQSTLQSHGNRTPLEARKANKCRARSQGRLGFVPMSFGTWTGRRTRPGGTATAHAASSAIRSSLPSPARAPACV